MHACTNTQILEGRAHLNHVEPGKGLSLALRMDTQPKIGSIHYLLKAISPFY